MNHSGEIFGELAGKNILLGVSAGIAAYKACELVRRLREAGAQVRVVMTPNATRFVTPLTLQALSGHPVRTSLWDEGHEAAMGHIELARWADCILIAPASAGLLARLASGMADDLLTTLCLASKAPLLLAPAMNHVMWAHPATQANVGTLLKWGAHMLGPDAGAQACGEVGEGRMLAPEMIVQQLTAALFSTNVGGLAGQRVIITAGATREAIDPVRFISNRSSGRMGYAVAEAARDAGGKVVLISGNTALPVPQGVTLIKVESALDMHAAVFKSMPCDIFIGTAAVADYRPAHMAAHKIKKNADSLSLQLVKNPDILRDVASHSPRPFTVGFAAETENLIEHARAKLVGKKLDMIAANAVGENLAFDQEDNALTVLYDHEQVTLPRANKRELAQKLIQLIAQRLATHA